MAVHEIRMAAGLADKRADRNVRATWAACFR